MIKANTCPYCGGPYTLYAGGCACEQSRAAAELIRDAADGDPGEAGEAERTPTHPRNAKRYRIVSTAHGYATDESLFWSNADGWVGIDSADTFTQAERDTLRLPDGGQWEAIP